ncbi:TonB-dependent receptor plug domain-containing protein [Sphingobacterium corticibacterium]|uniref:TonB-dependent receptor n=1 Tax=Sphingobacterium corticibacterium TaxID=2484746 RepID=A0A4Q6XJS7_9SPHI|nr:TonB-dependent receptor [Sphingobacterium corticibacterium]RZF60073.1 TonB-dependent receptor [Sphingobacterium corticibacterium]
MKKTLSVLLLCLPYVLPAQTANQPEKSVRSFELGEVVVTAANPTDSLSAVYANDMANYNRTTVGEALHMLPGIHLANIGARNESVVYLRGFNLRQTPVFIDGVPVYVPYDGYVDMGRFTTFDLAKIQISKGFASILYGANTMGGAINLVSRVPSNKLELNARTGIYSGEGYRWNINAGGAQGKFYYQLGLSQLRQETFPLSKDFTPVKYQMDYNRNNAQRNDVKASAKIGYTPTENQEYALGYVLQKGQKGNPPYLGESPRFWDWPAWNKESLYFIGNTGLGEFSSLKTRLYFDQFTNELFAYDDDTYTTQDRNSSFQSFYDDYTLGSTVQYEFRRWKNHNLQAGVQYKRDVHREHDLGDPVQRMIDNTLSIGVEDTYRISPSLSFIPGISWNYRNADMAEKYNADTDIIERLEIGSNAAVNAQLGLFWTVNSQHQVQATLARKTRFATMKDRFSFRMGRAIPNPSLHAESAIHYDLTYTGKIGRLLGIHYSMFRSDIDDVIQQVILVDQDKTQLQNRGRARFQGVELGLDASLLESLKLTTSYTYIHRKNLTDPDLYFTDVPNHKWAGRLGWQLPRNIAALYVDAEYNSFRYGSETGLKLDGFFLANTAAAIPIYRNLVLEAGVRNIFDRNYVLAEGFPEVGRNYFLNLSYSFQKK